MSDLDWRVVPIESWPGEQTRERKDHRFRTAVSGHSYINSRPGVNWSATVDLLEREIAALDGKNILLQMAVTHRDIRNDGWIRANARPEHPGVILTFDSRFGPLSYPCDTFDDWQANVRAIALALEALRKVDRYGVSKRGEQYTGYRQLGSGMPMPAVRMTVEDAAEFVAEACGNGFKDDAEHVVADAGIFRDLYRAAARRLHPDAGGSTGDFQRLQEAREVLERHHGS